MWGRFIVYVVGAVASLLFAGRLISVPNLLARVFGVGLIVGAINGALQASFVFYRAMWGVYPDWIDFPAWINALVMAFWPILGAYAFERACRRVD